MSILSSINTIFNKKNTEKEQQQKYELTSIQEEFKNCDCIQDYVILYEKIFLITKDTSVFKELKNIYERALYDAFEKEKSERLNILNELKIDLNNCLGHNCDIEINTFLKDVTEKIKNADRYYIESPIEESANHTDEYDDPLYNQVVEFAVQIGKISASLIQRRFKLGYNRAARLVDLLEDRHIVGPPNGSKPREVLVNVQNNNIPSEVLGEYESGNLYVSSENDRIYPKQEKDTRVLKYISDEEYHYIKFEKDYSYRMEYLVKIGVDTSNYIKGGTAQNVDNTIFVNDKNYENKIDLVNHIIKYNDPAETKLILIDISRLTFSEYNGDYHLLQPVTYGIKKIQYTINFIYELVFARMEKLRLNGKRSIYEYNKLNDSTYMYSIIIIVEEIYDLLLDDYIMERLIKILYHSENVGIKVIGFTKFSSKDIKKYINQDNIFKIYDCYNLESVIKPGLNDDSSNILVPTMSGYEFEEYCAKLLKSNGFSKIQITPKTGDFGADIIAYKEEMKYAIQCKFYSNSVGEDAVKEALGSKSVYRCHIAVVLTNSKFTDKAKILAKNNQVILWDKNKLDNMIKIMNERQDND